MEPIFKRKKERNSIGIAMHVSMVTIVINLLLSVFKLTAGILANSGAMISDAVHSASDVLSTVVVMIGVNIAGKKSDKEHPYGHDRMECVAAIILSAMLMATGIAIGINGVKKIAAGNGEGAVIPGLLALFAAVLSIAVKEWMYWYTRAAAKKINSAAVMADAWHHRSDALSSVGAMIGIAGARLGYPVLDPVASVVICLFIGKAAVDVFRDAMDKMVDKACDDETIQKMKESALAVMGVKQIDDIRTRMFGAKVYVDIEIAAKGNLFLVDSHEIAENVHLSIEKHFPDVKHCMVHVNPLPEPEDQENDRECL
ncbi:cation diffusion facilitator family transporter [Lacrimispora sphenoides]|jgi:cation diffusion facilitator family transporter|uniref:cation diffusion facilitator family transporter n=1 Tax=Lacrimispora sphenoides TaxID=29370 RepID=UPI0008BFC51E|nr:cation diffusion facilitator family transporter [Lacrimispora sphenoides]SEU31448.1 cation diffusion facilitator family transporter [Lacrimispora sphenoides]